MKVITEKVCLLFVLIGSFFLTGCKDALLSDIPSEKNAVISLMLWGSEMRAGSLFSGDDAINKVRVYVFNGSHAESIDVFSAGEMTFSNPFRIKSTTGEKTILVVANEPAGISAQLDAIKTIDQLDNIRLTTTTFLPVPLTMVGKATVNIPSQSTPLLMTVDLKRCVAKVTLKVKNASAGAEIELLQVKLYRNTGSTPLMEGVPGGSVQFWDVISGYNGFIPVTNEGVDVWGGSKNAAYVFENLGSVADTVSRATYLAIYAHYNNIPTQYVGYVNDESSNATDHHYSIKRNHQYNLTAELKNLGETNNLTLRTDVLPWNVIREDLVFKRVFRIDPHLTFNEKTIEVKSPADVVQFTFELKNPIEATWRAVLLNPIHFELVKEGGAVSSGEAGREYTIKIRPRNPQGSEERITELFIIVDDVEIPLLKGNTSIGPGNRIVIKQKKALMPFSK